MLPPWRQTRAIGKIPTVTYHQERKTLEQWGDYSATMTLGRTLPYESFLRSDGLSLIQRIESLEESVLAPQAVTGVNLLYSNKKLVLLGNAPSVKGLDIR